MPNIRRAPATLDNSQTKALDAGVIEVVVATNTRDRHGEILDINGLNTKSYSGVVLWGHDYFSFPIGKSLSLRKTKDGQLISRAQLAVDEYDFAETAYNLIKGGYITDASIGFIPQEYSPETDTWVKSEMVEYSLVSIGANPDAKISKKALEAVGLTKDIFEQQVRDMYKQMKKLDPDHTEEIEHEQQNPEALIIKGAIPPHKTAVDTDSAWDGGKNVGNIPNDAGASTLKKMYAWVDPEGDPDKKASYKFPHHMVSADGTVGAANSKACSAGIAVLNGGRGGTNIPDGDRKGVYNHLAKHISDGGNEPPELKMLAELDSDDTVTDNVLRYLQIAKSAIADTESALKGLQTDTAGEQTHKTKIVRKRVVLTTARKSLKSVDRVAELAIGELKKGLKESE